MPGAALVLLGYFISSTWIAVDSQRNQIATNDRPYGAGNGWLPWLILCLLLWIVGVPWYLVRRASVMKQRGSQAAAEPEGPAASAVGLPSAALVYCAKCEGGNGPCETWCRWCGSSMYASPPALPASLERQTHFSPLF
jgi:hypothetical protein